MAYASMDYGNHSSLGYERSNKSYLIGKIFYSEEFSDLQISKMNILFLLFSILAFIELTQSQLIELKPPHIYEDGFEPNNRDKRDLFHYSNKEFVRNLSKDFPYEITCMVTMAGHDDGDVSKGDIYYGTTQGLFFKTNGYPDRKNGNRDYAKVHGINSGVRLMDIFGISGLHVVTDDNRLYYVDNAHHAREDFDVPDPITSILTIHDTRRKSEDGDVYFGTTKGVYFRRDKIPAHKINGINGYVQIMQEQLDGTVHVVLGEPRYRITERRNNETIAQLMTKVDQLNDDNRLLEEQKSTLLTTIETITNHAGNTTK